MPLFSLIFFYFQACSSRQNHIHSQMGIRIMSRPYNPLKIKNNFRIKQSNRTRSFRKSNPTTKQQKTHLQTKQTTRSLDSCEIRQNKLSKISHQPIQIPKDLFRHPRPRQNLLTHDSSETQSSSSSEITSSSWSESKLHVK